MLKPPDMAEQAFLAPNDSLAEVDNFAKPVWNASFQGKHKVVFKTYQELFASLLTDLEEGKAALSALVWFASSPGSTATVSPIYWHTQ